MKPKNQAALIITILCIVLGTLIGLQFKAVKKSKENGNLEQQRSSQLAQDLRKKTEQVESLMKQIAEKNKVIDNYENTAAEENEWAEILKQDLEKARVVAGITAVNGPGVVVTLDDNKEAVQNTDENVDPNLFIIHDEDILKVVNELRAAGAEAISVNNQRVMGRSAIRCVGPVINVNDVRIGPPFVIYAVGNADTLEAALKLPKGIIDNLSFWGVKVKIEKAKNLDIPAYSQGIDIQYAKPVKKEGE